MTDQRQILVYGDWTRDDPVLLGQLRFQYGRGKEVSSFVWSEEFLDGGFRPFLDPDVVAAPGEYFCSDGMFGMFQDAAPDSWGRKLVDRKELYDAERSRRAVRALSEADYLLEIFDRTRIGALRFKESADGDFRSSDSRMAAPPWTSLRALQDSARRFEEDADDFDEKWLVLLFAPGSSLGGARPKANVTDENGDLWIAKFPARNDRYDVGAWEFLVHELAREAGIDVPEARLERFSDEGSTFLCKRFDRQGPRRIHFASAMTMLGCTDRQESGNGTYVDIAEFLVRQSSNAAKDLSQLWRRIVFSLLVSNTDDHLRNHGFLMNEKGWRLSPAFDLSANVRRAGGLTLTMDGKTPIRSVDDILSFAALFRLKENEAREIVSQVACAVRGWRVQAGRLGIGRQEMLQYEGCFALANA